MNADDRARGGDCSGVNPAQPGPTRMSRERLLISRSQARVLRGAASSLVPSDARQASTRSPSAAAEMCSGHGDDCALIRPGGPPARVFGPTDLAGVAPREGTPTCVIRTHPGAVYDVTGCGETSGRGGLRTAECRQHSDMRGPGRYSDCRQGGVPSRSGDGGRSS